MCTKRFGQTVFAILIMTVISVFQAHSQSGEDDWYYGKPIKNIVFANLKNVKDTDLEGVTSKYIAMEFSDDIVTELYSRIDALEYFDDIEISAARGKDDGKTVNVIVNVIEKPVVTKITFAGNHQLRDSDLKTKTSLKLNDVFMESKLSADERSIRNYYIEKGFTKASVVVSYDQKDSGIYIRYDIEEGKKSIVKEIRFAGNLVISSRTLKKKLSLKESGLFSKGAYQESTLSADSRAILTYYRNRGYADAKVINVNQETSYNEKKLREEIIITFEIFEGEQYTFGGLTFEGNKVFPTSQLEKLVKLKKDSIYNETKFQESKAAVQNLYYENGYTANRFTDNMQKDAELRVISYTLTIDENIRSHIENVLIKGNEKTKDYVIRREIPIDNGDIFSNSKISNGMRNLYNLQFFSAVTPEILQGSEENLVDIVFNVEEQSTTSLDFGFTFSGVSDPDDFPVALYAKLQDSNLFGEGKSASVSTTLSTDEQSFSVGYGQNWTFGKPISTNVSLSYTHSNPYALRAKILPSGDMDQDYYYMQYEQNEFGFSYSMGHRWTPNFAILTVSGGLSTSLINNIYDSGLWIPYDSAISQYQDNWEPRNSIWTAFSADGRNINYDPSKGWFASQRFTWYGLIKKDTFSFAPEWGEKEFYLRTDTKLEKYFTLLDLPVTETWSFRSVLAAYSGLSFQLPANGTVIKRNNQLYIDGMFTGRGWTIYNTNEGRGKALWVNALELRFPVLTGLLSFDIWGDAVAIKDEPKDLFSNLTEEDWYFSFGPSIRFTIQQFPLRLLFANTFKMRDGNIVFVDGDGDGDYNWTDNFRFVLSFNMTNR